MWGVGVAVGVGRCGCGCVDACEGAISIIWESDEQYNSDFKVGDQQAPTKRNESHRETHM